MKSILLLTILVFAMCNRDLLVELEAKAKPLPVVKCLIASEIIRKDVVVVVDAVKQFLEDKNAFVLLTKLLAVYPQVEAEVKRCLKEEGVNLKSIPNLPNHLQKIWNKLSSSVKKSIINAYKTGKLNGKRECLKHLGKDQQKKQICIYLDKNYK